MARFWLLAGSQLISVADVRMVMVPPFSVAPVEPWVLGAVASSSLPLFALHAVRVRARTAVVAAALSRAGRLERVVRWGVHLKVVPLEELCCGGLARCRAAPGHGAR